MYTSFSVYNSRAETHSRFFVVFYYCFNTLLLLVILVVYIYIYQCLQFNIIISLVQATVYKKFVEDLDLDLDFMSTEFT